MNPNEMLRAALRNTRRGWHLPLLGVCLFIIGVAPITGILMNAPNSWPVGLPFLIFVYGGYVALRVYTNDLFNPQSKAGFSSTLSKYRKKFRDEGLSPIDADFLAEDFARSDHNLPVNSTLPTQEERARLADFYQAQRNQQNN